MLTKEEFITYVEFIQKQREKQANFVDSLGALAPGCYCDAYIYDEYETKLLDLLQKILNDEGGLISYKLYEFDEFDFETKQEQLKETPEVETWETVYDYLTK